MNSDNPPSPQKEHQAQHHHHNNDKESSSSVSIEQPPQWILGKNNEKVQTIFFQSFGNTRLEVAAYTGQWGILMPDDKHVCRTAAIEAIRYPLVGPELKEIRPYSASTQANLSYIWHPFQHVGRMFAFCSASCADRVMIPSAMCLANKKDMVADDLPTFHPFALQMSRVNLGQSGDIREHARKMKIIINTASITTISQTAETEVPLPKFKPSCILYGVSRGAAATFNAVATQNYTNVKLVILEGCYSNVKDVLTTEWTKWLSPLVEAGIAFTTAYVPSGFSPIGLVDKFPTDIPVGFVTSYSDQKVTVANTMKLVDALRDAGHENVYVLRLRDSPHSRYTSDNHRDRTAYQYWLHALYQRYDLPHVPEYAQDGLELLDDHTAEGFDGGTQDDWFADRNDWLSFKYPKYFYKTNSLTVPIIIKSDS